MLVLLGFLMIFTFMILIMTKRMSPLLALIIVPTIFGLFTGAGLGMGEMVMDSVKSLSSTAALLMFAIIYFGIMIDAGLFDRLVNLIVRIAGNDPVKVVVGTALLTGAISLDGDGSTTFIVVTAALLPIYQRLGLSPVVLTCTAALTNGTLNVVPWGGPTARAAAALNLEASDVFVPMVPSLVVGIIFCIGFAWMMGRSERKRLAAGIGLDQSFTATAGQLTALDPDRSSLRPRLLWFNLILTVALMVLLVIDILPLAYLFMIGAAIALLVNYPSLKDQAERLSSHANAVIAVVSMVLAAAVLTGILSGTGMVDAMARWLVDIIPTTWGPYLAVITGVLSMPLTFFMSNDAFYFGILPVLSETASHYGIAPADMARASITGQPVHLQSPLVPAVLLLVSLAGVQLGDHHRKVLWRAVIVSLVMLVVGILVGAITMG